MANSRTEQDGSDGPGPKLDEVVRKFFTTETTYPTLIPGVWEKSDISRDDIVGASDAVAASWPDYAAIRILRSGTFQMDKQWQRMPERDRFNALAYLAFSDLPLRHSNQKLDKKTLSYAPAEMENGGRGKPAVVIDTTKPSEFYANALDFNINMQHPDIDSVQRMSDAVLRARILFLTQCADHERKHEAYRGPADAYSRAIVHYLATHDRYVLPDKTSVTTRNPDMLADAIANYITRKMHAIVKATKGELPPLGTNPPYNARVGSDEVMVYMPKGRKVTVEREEPRVQLRSDFTGQKYDEYIATPTARFDYVPASMVVKAEDRKRLSDEFRGYLESQTTPDVLAKTIYDKSNRAFIMLHAPEVAYALRKRIRKHPELKEIAAKLDGYSPASDKEKFLRLVMELPEHQGVEGAVQLHKLACEVSRQDYYWARDHIQSFHQVAGETLKEFFKIAAVQKNKVPLSDHDIEQAVGALLKPSYHCVEPQRKESWLGSATKAGAYEVSVDTEKLSQRLQPLVRDAVAHYEDRMLDASKKVQNFVDDKSGPGVKLETALKPALPPAGAQRLWDNRFLRAIPEKDGLPRRLVLFSLKNFDLEIMVVDTSDTNLFYSGKPRNRIAGHSSNSMDRVYLGQGKDFEVELSVEELCHNALKNIYHNHSKPWQRDSRPSGQRTLIPDDPRRTLFMEAVNADLRRLGGKNAMAAMYCDLNFDAYRFRSKAPELPVKVLVQMITGEWDKENKSALYPNLTHFVEHIIGRDLDAADHNRRLPDIDIASYRIMRDEYAHDAGLLADPPMREQADFDRYRQSKIGNMFMHLPIRQMNMNGQDTFIIPTDLLYPQELQQVKNRLKLSHVKKQYITSVETESGEPGSAAKERRSVMYDGYQVTQAFRPMFRELQKAGVKKVTGDCLMVDAETLNTSNTEVYKVFYHLANVDDKAFKDRVSRFGGEVVEKPPGPSDSEQQLGPITPLAPVSARIQPQGDYTQRAGNKQESPPDKPAH
jgi:hypothetical protein